MEPDHKGLERYIKESRLLKAFNIEWIQINRVDSKDYLAGREIFLCSIAFVSQQAKTK
ncbi:hypothetical protein KJ640_03125 [bacterium]|nr:hypothetical protein [bacterium]